LSVIVVCDTTPLNYLLLIDAIHLLPALYGRICIPSAVQHEMLHAKAPVAVRAWAADPPEWVLIEPDLAVESPDLIALDSGESQAIAAVEFLRADFLLTDDLPARRVAHARGIRVLTTLLILDAAADRGWISFPDAALELVKTNFRVDRSLIDQLVTKHLQRGKG
jgi:predicted nucleic acid-binding protein